MIIDQACETCGRCWSMRAPHVFVQVINFERTQSFIRDFLQISFIRGFSTDFVHSRDLTSFIETAQCLLVVALRRLGPFDGRQQNLQLFGMVVLPEFGEYLGGDQFPGVLRDESENEQTVSTEVAVGELLQGRDVLLRHDPKVRQLPPDEAILCRPVGEGADPVEEPE